MAMTVDELAIVVDSTVEICTVDGDVADLTLQIIGLQIRVGAGPELADVTGVGTTADEARTNYAANVANKVAVLGGNPRGLEVHVPITIIGF
jgi:hypothetical protein